MMKAQEMSSLMSLTYLQFIYRVLELSTILSITVSLLLIYISNILITSTKCRIGLIQQMILATKNDNNRDGSEVLIQNARTSRNERTAGRG